MTDPNEFAKWLVEGLKETLAYRIRETFDRKKLLALIQSKLPTRNQLVHHALKRSLKQAGFEFETINQGDATFQVIRKKYREVPKGKSTRRLILVPGFGDTPGSWLPVFGFSRREILKNFDELLIVDFPGYLGFLSHERMVPSMSVLLGAVKTVCEANPPTVLVGHSLGGWLAAKVAQMMQYPFEHLVLIAPSGLTPEDERQAFADFVLSHRNGDLQDLIQKVVHEPKRYHYLLKDEFAHFYSQPEINEFIQSVKADQFIDQTSSFSCKKVSVIWGEQDQFVPTNWIRHWVEHFGTHTDAYVLSNTGHLPQLESPKVLSQVFMHAILGKTSRHGEGWKKVHARVKEFAPESSIEFTTGTRRIGSTS